MGDKKTNAEAQAMNALVAGLGRNPRAVLGNNLNCGYCGWTFQTWLSALGKRKKNRKPSDKPATPSSTKS